MYADLKRGFEGNAEAAFELMIELSWAGGGTYEEWELNGKNGQQTNSFSSQQSLVQPVQFLESCFRLYLL